MAPAQAFEFSVSAPAAETFAWLRARGERSGEVVAEDPAAHRCAVRWDAHGAPLPVTLDLAVVAAGAFSHVTVAVEADALRPMAAIGDFAGPLGERMTGLRTQPPGFFVPERTARDDLMLCAWAGLFVVALSVIAATRHLPPAGQEMSARELVVNVLVPIGVAAFAAGAIGGLVVRRGGRCYELVALGLAGGWLASFLVFDVWFNAIEPETDGSDIAMGFGAALAAVPEAFLVLAGVLVGRAPAAVLWCTRRLRAHAP
jgi:hypothetical protein